MHSKNKPQMKNLSFMDGEYKTALEILNGTEKDQWAEFSNGKCNLVVRFDTEVRGWVEKTPGDYWTPPFSETVLEKVNIYITGFSIDDVEMEVDPPLESALAELVKKLVE